MRQKHQRFVEEYARDRNATAAYQRAGYRARGHAAEVNASRLRKRPEVAAAIEVAVARAYEEAFRRLRSSSWTGRDTHPRVGYVQLQDPAVRDDARVKVRG
jgi:hypothetical protein